MDMQEWIKKTAEVAIIVHLFVVMKSAHSFTLPAIPGFSPPIHKLSSIQVKSLSKGSG